MANADRQAPTVDGVHALLEAAQDRIRSLTASEQLFRMMLDTGSGKKTKSELHGYGQSEVIPWYLGAVM